MNNSIIEKIHNLRKLSKSDNINEATAAAIAADKLISKFRISEAEISAHTGEVPEKAKDILYESARAITWKYRLANTLSEHYGCYMFNDNILSDNGRIITRLRLVGLKSDMDIVSYMFAWLVFEIEKLNKKNKGKGHIVCNSFCIGAVSGIAEQLAALKEQEKINATENNQIQALAVLDSRSEQAKIFINSIMQLKSSTKKTHNYLDGNAYTKGLEAGKNLHLGKVMNGVGNKLLSE